MPVLVCCHQNEYLFTTTILAAIFMKNAWGDGIAQPCSTSAD
jgi:hypothetical protein